MAASASAVREQIAFYAATPAYRPVLDVHGWADLQTELNAMTRAGRWKEMGKLIDDDVLHAFAVVAEPDRVATEVLRRYRGIFTRMHLYLKTELDGDVLAGICAQIRADHSA